MGFYFMSMVLGVARVCPCVLFSRHCMTCKPYVEMDSYTYVYACFMHAPWLARGMITRAYTSTSIRTLMHKMILQLINATCVIHCMYAHASTGVERVSNEGTSALGTHVLVYVYVSRSVISAANHP